ncbi:MAG: hypothetical protein Ct9H300mP25_00360 [Acidobacteriota bacterium]|nr:MAG: hypothetical protein Ct9H300mP25_00360 [Acidobacteriota bacterium]
MAQVLDLKFSRIQFTPDLMPSDITGTDIIQEDPESGGRKMVFAQGRCSRTSCWVMRLTGRRRNSVGLLEAMQDIVSRCRADV